MIVDEVKEFNRNDNQSYYDAIESVFRRLDTSHVNKYLAIGKYYLFKLDYDRSNSEEQTKLVVSVNAFDIYTPKEMAALAGLEYIKQKNDFDQDISQRLINSSIITNIQSFLSLAALNSFYLGDIQSASGYLSSGFFVGGLRSWARESFVNKVIDEFGEKLGDFETLNSALKKAETASQTLMPIEFNWKNRLSNNPIARFFDKTLSLSVADQGDQIKHKISEKVKSYADQTRNRGTSGDLER
jgi:hypothetical protein